MTKQLSSYLGIPSLVLPFPAIGSRRSMEQWCSKVTHRRCRVRHLRRRCRDDALDVRRSKSRDCGKPKDDISQAIVPNCVRLAALGCPPPAREGSAAAAASQRGSDPASAHYMFGHDRGGRAFVFIRKGDAPFHRYAGGKDLAALPLESLAGMPASVCNPP